MKPNSYAVLYTNKEKKFSYSCRELPGYSYSIEKIL
jgi:hypothetical protein